VVIGGLRAVVQRFFAVENAQIAGPLRRVEA
jgi:hypothetical protein